MPRASRRSAQPPSPTDPVRVLRLEDDQAVTVRFLGGYEGTLTHWVQGHSIPCIGEAQCPLSVHRARTLWKGYAPVEWWSEGQRVWYPAVLEITEGLEEVLRGRSLRGEVWHLTRPKVRRESNPVLGAFCERVDATALPAAFSLLAVVERFFHPLPVVLGAKNPLPAPVRVEPSHGPAPHVPAELLPLPAVEQTAADRKRIAEEVRKAGGMRAQYEATAKRQAEERQGGSEQRNGDRGR
jgi:hypothetical protein